MAAAVEGDFISSFHNLPGTTIKEKTKNLYILLNKTKQLLSSTDGKILLSSLTPKTPLEESFKVTALIHFKCAHELLQVLKSENPILIDRVLKQSSWIIKQSFNDITPEFLATQLFPSISYNAKIKLLNQLSYHFADTKKADLYFESIKEHYGLYLASKLLPCCSSDLILKCLKSYKIDVTPKQLLLILKKYPNLTEILFEKLDQQNAKMATGEKYISVLKCLSKDDLNTFIKLYKKYSPDIHLGPKQSDTFIKSVLKINVFKDNIKIGKILKPKQIGKSMGNDFKDFYLANFPRCMSQLKENLSDQYKLLSYLPNGEQKLKMFSTTFRNVYGNDLWQYHDFIRQDLIEWMSPDERTKWMESHSRPSGISEEIWISYYKTDKSLPLLKEKILLTSGIQTRSNYIQALIKTCKLNNDKSALLNVLKYVNLKHRNDNNRVLEGVLILINELYQETHMTKEICDEIFQCIQIFVLNQGYYYYNRDLLEKCIHYRLSNGLSVDNILEFFAKHYPGIYNICVKSPKFCRQCLIQFENLVPLGFKKEELNDGYVRFLCGVSIYNTANPRDKIQINFKKEYIEFIKNNLEHDKYNYDSQIAALVIIDQDLNRAEEEGILELFFNQDYYNIHQLKVMELLIKENPLLLLKYFKYMLKASSHQNYIPKFAQKYCTKYKHLDIPKKICELCYNVLNDKEETNNSRIKTAVILLSTLLTPEEFVSFSSTYYPIELSLDLNSDDNQIFYIKQQTVAGHFRNLIPISHTLDAILQFCQGDYLKFAQKSVQVAAADVAENKLLPFFTTLKQRAVSIRKHAIFLSPRVLNKTQADYILLDLNQREKNSSLRKVLFKSIFHSFLNNPNMNSWNLTKQSMEAVDFSDGEAFEILTSCRFVPLEYFDKYLDYSWSIIQKCTSSNTAVEDGQLRLLNLAGQHNISALSTNICTRIIHENLFKCEKLSNLQKGIQSFVCRYIIFGAGSDEERLNMVFIILEDFIKNNWSNIKTMTLTFKLVHNFIKQFCDEIMDKKCTNKSIFEKFLCKWVKLLEPSKNFHEFVDLQLTSVYLTAKDKNLHISEIGQNVASICNLLDKQDCFVAKYFSICLNTFLKSFYELKSVGESDENEIIFIENMVNARSSCACLELAVYLLPAAIPVAPHVKEKYDYITDIISKESNHKVQIIFRNYLRNVIIPNA